jgi:hypothetical protein
VMEVDPLVALEPDQPRAGGPGERLGHLCLADARLTLEEQRLLELEGKVYRCRQSLVGQIPLTRERVLDCGGAIEAQRLTASSSALRVSTRARWRL